MPSLSSTRAFNNALALPYRPVGVFVGGTSGIGEGIVRAFANNTKGDADIVIVGRNRAAGEAILASLPAPSKAPAPRREFVDCDAVLMRNVQRTTEELAQRLPRLNFLVITTGIMTMDGRNETEEGIDRKLALHYYSRWKFIHNLTPLLQKAKDNGQEAKTLSVLAAGFAGPIEEDDLGLKKKFTLQAAALQAPTYNDLMIESFAAQHPSLSFSHSAPGLVNTPLLKVSNSTMMRWAAPLASGLMYVVGTSKEDCGEFMLYGLLRAPAGASRFGRHGDDLAGEALHTTPEGREKLWAHTLKETRTAA